MNPRTLEWETKLEQSTMTLLKAFAQIVVDDRGNIIETYDKKMFELAQRCLDEQIGWRDFVEYMIMQQPDGVYPALHIMGKNCQELFQLGCKMRASN